MVPRNPRGGRAISPLIRQGRMRSQRLTQWMTVTSLATSVVPPAARPGMTIPPPTGGVRTTMTVMVAMAVTTTSEASGPLAPRPTSALTPAVTVTDPPGVTIMAATRMDVAGLGWSGTLPSHSSVLPSPHRSRSRFQWIEDCKTFLRLTPNPCAKHCRRSTTTTSHNLPSRGSCEEIGCAKRKIMSRLRRRPLFNSALLRAARRQRGPRQARRPFSRQWAILLPQRLP